MATLVSSFLVVFFFIIAGIDDIHYSFDQFEDN